MFIALDRISEDDDRAVQPVGVPVYLSGSRGMVRVQGLDTLFDLGDGTSLDAVRRLLQRHLDTLRNSEAASFLYTNRTSSGNMATHVGTGATHVTVRVPRAVAEALDGLQ